MTDHKNIIYNHIVIFHKNDSKATTGWVIQKDLTIPAVADPLPLVSLSAARRAYNGNGGTDKAPSFSSPSNPLRSGSLLLETFPMLFMLLILLRRGLLCDDWSRTFVAASIASRPTTQQT